MLDQAFGRMETGAETLTYKVEDAEDNSMCKQEHCEKAKPSAARAPSKRSDSKACYKVERITCIIPETSC
jgi:hypothetical protein